MKILGVILLSFIPLISYAQNLLTNGSFETHDAVVDSGSGKTQNIDNPTTYLDNSWTFGRTQGTGGNGRYHWYSTTNKQTWQNNPQDGSYAIQLNSDNGSDFIYVEQAVNVVSGSYYELSFYFIDESAFGIADPSGMQVVLSGAFSSTQTFTNTINDTWEQGTISFVASITGSLNIRSTDNPPTGNNQQNISLDNIVLVVPEPSTYLTGILLLGLIGFYFANKRKLRSQP